MTEPNAGAGVTEKPYIVGYRPSKGGGNEYVFSDGSITPDIRGGAPDDDDDGGNDKAITFASEVELQEHMNKHLNKRFGEINTAAEAKSQEAINTLNTKIESLEAKIAEGKGGNKSKEGDNADLTAMKAKVEALEEKDRKSLLLSTTGKLTSVASELNAINGAQVAQLVSSSIKTAEDGTLTVLNPKGETLYGADGEPMSIKEYLAGFLGENKHLVKPSGGTGAGSQGSRSTNGTNDLKKYADLSAVDRISAYRADHPTT